MSMRFAELVKNESQKATQALAPGLIKTEKDIEQYSRDLVLLSEMMSTTGKYRGPRISMEEALMSPYASILFPKVISDIMLRPKEPIMIGQTLLAKTVMIDNTRSVEFPVLGALRAFDMSEVQEYREQNLSFGEHLTEIKVNKVGLQLAISEDVIKDAMWDVLALYLEAAGYAMLRHKEEKIFWEFTENGHVVFDNSLLNPAAWTAGRDANQNLNGTIAFDDLIDLMGGIVANEYIPTDILMHPLAWVIFAKDPVLRNVLLTGGQIGQSIWTQIPQFDQQVNMPWNINYVVTPFINLSLNTTIATGPASGYANSNVTDVVVIDRQNACVVLQRDAMEIEHFDDPRRDIQLAKLRERYGVGSINAGKAAAVAKNIRIDTNYAPLNTVFSTNVAVAGPNP